MPWYWRWLGMGFMGIAAACLLWIAYGRALTEVAQHQADDAMKRLTDANAELATTNAAMKSELAVLERQLQIERATYGHLVKEVRVLSHENARLKEDVALVQTISASDSKIDGVKVSSVRIEPNPVAGEYSYRIVLLQTGSRLKHFQGSYQLVINLMQGGKRTGMTVPTPGNSKDSPYQLDFRVHQRIDGTFKVDPAAVVRSVQLRVFEGSQSQPRVMQTVTLS